MVQRTAAVTLWLGTLAVGASGCGGSSSAVSDGTSARVEAIRSDVELGIYMADVGNGDATVVLGPPQRDGTRRSLLVDAGKLRADGGHIVSDLLDDLGVGRLDYVVATHYDSDHVGGFVTVLGSSSVLWEDEGCAPGPHFPTGTLVDLGPTDRDTQTYREYESCVAQTTGNDGPEHWIVSDGEGLGRSFDLGGDWTATLVAGDGWVIDGAERTPYVNTANERSIAVLVSGPEGFDFLVTGDLIGKSHGSENAPVEPALARALAARGVDLEVLRLGHNGADNATARETIAALRPETALISVSAQNDYGHPGCETQAALAGMTIAQTQAGASPCGPTLDAWVADGTVAVWVTGARYEVRSVGAVSPATGRPTQAFVLDCTVDAGCGDAASDPDAVPDFTPVEGEVVITEIMANPDAVSDADGEWVELFSVANADVRLDGCVLRDEGSDRYTFDDVTLVPGQVFTVARSDSPGFTPDLVASGLVLANGTDELLLECRGQIIDLVRWTSSVAGRSRSLSGDAYSAEANDASAAWCVGIETYGADYGTPGFVNPPCTP